MKFLVTGANGQLGCSLQSIASEYSEHGFVFCDLPQADITDRNSMQTLLLKGDNGIVVNCAAYTAVDSAESEPETADRVNRLGPAILGQLCRENDLKLIHISTDYVFDGTRNAPLKETDPTNPLSVYGRTKLAGEKAVAASGCDAVVIRTGWLYSPFGSNFVKTMLRLGSEGVPVRVVDDQHGTPTYAADFARAIIRIAENGIKGFDIYHYSDAGKTTWHGFAREIFSRAGIAARLEPITTAEYPTPARRPAYGVLSKEKIIAAGATVPQWEESLGKCLEAMGL